MVPRISEILKKLYINNSIKKFIEKKLIQKDKICYTLFYKLTFSKTQCVTTTVQSKILFVCLFYSNFTSDFAEPFYQSSQTPQALDRSLSQPRLGCVHACLPLSERDLNEIGLNNDLVVKQGRTTSYQFITTKLSYSDSSRPIFV